MRAEMKSFAERNRLAIGTVGIVVVAAVALAALQYQRLPFFNQGTRVSAYFADAGGLRTGNTVEVSGYPVGKVSSISLDGPGVLVEFKVDTDVRLGNRTEVAIKTKGLLGSKFLDVTPRGDGRLDSPIPIERTTSPYQLPDALGDLAATISGLHTERLSESLATLAQTNRDNETQTCPLGVGDRPGAGRGRDPGHAHRRRRRPHDRGRLLRQQQRCVRR
ncbi:virulence factor mce family protein [Mycobacterium tuberculosis]|nr:virulence factor mce family protein [Mycobacterium tuberculosis]